MTTPDDHNRDDRALAGEYALGLLSLDAVQAFEDRLGREPELRALYAEWAEDFTGFASGIPEEMPAPHVLGGIEDILFDEKRQPLWRRLKLVESFFLAGIAAVFAFVAVNFGWFEPDLPQLQAQIAAEDRSLVIEAQYDISNQTLRLERTSGEVTAGRSQELWLIAGTNAPVSLGVLSEARETFVVIPAKYIAAMPTAVLAISDEPLGGSPTGVATGAVLAAGPITGT